MTGRTITIPAPHVPHGPVGIPQGEADAMYLRRAADRIRDARPFGSNLTATVVKLLNDAAAAVDLPAATTERA